MRSLRGRPGMGITITINEQTQFFPGTHGTPSHIELNGKISSLNHPINENDNIKVTPGMDGTTPLVYLRAIAKQPPSFTILINNQSYDIVPTIFVNGKLIEDNPLLADRDQVFYHLPATLDEVLAATGNERVPVPFAYTINGTERIYGTWPQYTINNTPAQASTPVTTHDAITVILPSEPTLGELLGIDNSAGDVLTLLFNGTNCSIPLRQVNIRLNNSAAKPTDIAPCGSIIEFSYTQQHHPMISEVLFAANFNPKNIPPGSIVTIHLNKQPTEYTTIVKNGDEIDVIITAMKTCKKS